MPLWFFRSGNMQLTDWPLGRDDPVELASETSQPGGEASPKNQFPVCTSRSIVTPAAIISQSSFPRRRVTGQPVNVHGNASKFELAYGRRAPAPPSIRLLDEEVAEGAGASASITLSGHQARRSQLKAAWGDRATRADFEQERWSGGSGTGGNPLTWRLLWTTAIFAATTAAISTAVVADPIRTSEGANKVSCKPDSEESRVTTETLVGGSGCGRGCEGTTSSCCQIIGDGGGEEDGISKNQVSAIIPAAASNAAGAGGDMLSASAPVEKKPLRQTRSSDTQLRHSAWNGVGTSGGSSSSGGLESSREGPPVLLKESGIVLEGGVSALRGGEKPEGGAAVDKQEEESPWAGKTVALAGRPLFTSVKSTKGHRAYMEDEFFLSSDGSFSAVFDGHGGAGVSKYLRRNLYRNFVENLPSKGEDPHDLKTVEQALQAAYQAVDKYVTTQTSYYEEGSCAVSVTMHCDRQRKASLISCNVGDSRAVLCRGGGAVDLTEDHKPDAPRELERIFRLGGMVTWDGLESSQGLPIEGTGVYRINGNLAVARTIGDADHRPWVSGEMEIRTIEINRESDQFVILASDGLWDVMSSEEAVQYVHSVMGGTLGAGSKGREEEQASNEAGSGAASGKTTLVNWAQSYPKDRGIIRTETMLCKKKMASYLTAEAMRRGSMDNTTVAIVWL